MTRLPVSDREWVRLHIDTLFTHDAQGRIVHVNDRSARPAPRFYLARTASGCEWRFRNDQDDKLVTAIDAVCRAEPWREAAMDAPIDASKLEAPLNASAPIQRRWAGPIFRFPQELTLASDTHIITAANAQLLERHFTDWLDDVPQCQPFLAVVQAGHAVSLCASVRRSEAAHQAGVETTDAFRGRGYAAHVTAAWAHAVRGSGCCCPLYSTSWENAASRALAARLKLILFGADLHFT